MTNDSDDITPAGGSTITRALLEALAAAHTENAEAHLVLRDAVCAFIDQQRRLGHSLDDSVSAVRASVRRARGDRRSDARDVALANGQLEQMIHWCVSQRMA